jgi:hypothetical protein
MKLWFFALLIPTLVYSFVPTQRSDCSAIDLRNELLGKVRNQGPIAWCYAFTAADMLNEHYQIPEKISAADVAIGYNQTNVGLFMRWLDANVISRKDPNIKNEAHQTGFNKKALLSTMKDGWCPESVFPSEKWTKITLTEGNFRTEEVNLKEAMKDISFLFEKRKSLTSENLPFYFQFKNVDANVFLELLDTKFLAGFYFKLRERVCAQDRISFDHSSKVKMSFKSPHIFQSVAEQLEKEKIVGLDYDSRILKDSSSRGFKINQLHTSIILGRRWNSEASSCEYLIRNSWGEDCGRYDPTYECQSGHAWLDESKIFSSMTSIVYMP